VEAIKVIGAKTDVKKKEGTEPRMVRGFLSVMTLLGGLQIFGATGDLVSAGRYDLLFGPAELAQSVFTLGDTLDDKMALQSALAREYGVTNNAEVIRLLSDCYGATNPVAITTTDLNKLLPGAEK